MNAYDRLDSYLCSHPRRTFFIFSTFIVLAAIFYCWWVDARGYLGEAESFNFAYADAIFNGIAPFTPYEDLRWEYPPLAYLTFLLPRLFTDDPHTYVYVFGFQMAAVCIVGAALLMKIAGKLERSYTPLLIIYVASIFSLNYFIFDRFDIVVAVLTIAALYLYTQKKYSWAVVLIVVGMFIKLYPAILFPALIIPMLADGRYRLAVRQIVLFLVLSAIIMIPFIYGSPDNVWNFLTYHSDRGLQIESVASSIILMFTLYGFTSVNWDFTFGSYNIHGGVADAIVPYLMPLMMVMIVLAYVLFYLWCRGRTEKETFEGTVFASVLLIMFFILFNKVFSAQYVVWITVPMIMAYAYYRGTKTRNMLLAALIMNILTYAMVKTSSDLMSIEPVGIWLLFIRNILVVAMTMKLCYDMDILWGFRKKIAEIRLSRKNTCQ